MAENFDLVSESMRQKLGRKLFFAHGGKVVLMSLKMCMGLICPKLMEQLNGNPLLDILRRNNSPGVLISKR